MSNMEHPPPLCRENVRMLHGVYCYRDRSNRRFASIEDYDQWSGTCICHHAVWHSCPDKSKGERMFDAMSTLRVEALSGPDVVDGELVRAIAEIAPVRRPLARRTF